MISSCLPEEREMIGLEDAPKLAVQRVLSLATSSGCGQRVDRGSCSCSIKLAVQHAHREPAQLSKLAVQHRPGEQT